MTAPADREFQVLARGWIRDNIILANWRAGLRKLTNPETGVLFTEDEIARATQVGSRWWIEADAIDLQGQLAQREGIYLSDQGRMERANSEFLENFHGRLWGEEKLPATGGSGLVTIQGVAGTVVVGSTTIPDPAAYSARDGAGKIYQVFVGGAVGVGGTVDLTMVAVDTGATTNLETGDKLTWITKDPNMGPEATVASDFTGGTDLETDGEFASRMAGNVQHKQAAGNDAHFRAWGRKASNAIEDAFVYPCALHAGSVVVAITQKRGTTVGPLARIPSLATIATAVAYLTPPGSPVVPARAFVLVVPVQSQTSYAYLYLDLPKGTAEGWADVIPWPDYHISCAVLAKTSDTDFTINCPANATLPGGATTLSGADAPKMMFWDDATSTFKVASVANIHWHAATTYHVTLTAPAVTIAVGMRVCPLMSRHALVSAAVQQYFDEMGPGDFFNVAADPRAARCARFPAPSDEYPTKIGAALAVRVMEALGAVESNASVAWIWPTITPYPTSVSSGPYIVTCGQIGVYAL